MRVELKENVLNVMFDSPKSNNAFDLSMAKALGKILLNKKFRLIVFSSQGRVFCSGGNLREYAGLKTKQQGVKINKEIRGVLDKLYKYPAPKVALVTGDCFGGGIELLSCCDFIFTEPHVFFGMWQRKMALSFGWGGYKRLKNRMSEAALKNWLLSGEIKTASACQQLGLVDEVVSEGKMRERFLAFQKNILSFNLESYKGIQSLDVNEAQVFEKLWWSEDHRKILQSFKK